MMPKKTDLTCYRGESWSRTVRFRSDGEPVLLDGITARAQIRRAQNSDTLIAEMDCAVTPEEGKVCLSLPAETTALICPGSYEWDLKLTTDAGKVSYWLQGKFTVSGRVTE